MRCLVAAVLLALSASAGAQPGGAAPYVVVLGVGQDGGVPQIGTPDHPGWQDPAFRHLVVSLAVVDPATGERWLFEATPDLREQLHRLDLVAPTPAPRPGLAGIFLTHAHMGHYTGLLHLGHEAMGAHGVPVHVMPRFAEMLRTHEPWALLVRRENLALQPLADGVAVRLNDRLTVTPVLVPHRQELSEVVGFRIDGPTRSVFFLPDIDAWDAWDAEGTRIEDVLATVDVAYLDATFYANGEIPGRDMSTFPHPFVTTTMARLAPLPASDRAKVRFLHVNHTNPAGRPGSPERRAVHAAGFRMAEALERVDL